MTLIDFYEQRRYRLQQQKEEFKATNENIEKIKKHWSTTPINYPEQKEAFDYVDELFPHCHVKEVTVYKANRDYLAQLGFRGIGGFCHETSKSVVLSSHLNTYVKKTSPYQIKGIIKPDEAIVHELIHYCYFFEENSVQSMHLKEEFAYGFSIDYLRGHGLTDEEIIKNNFLPYLYGAAEKRVAVPVILNKEDIIARQFDALPRVEQNRLYKKHRPTIHQQSLDKGYERGREIIEIYDRKLKEKRGIIEEASIPKQGTTRFDILDI